MNKQTMMKAALVSVLTIAGSITLFAQTEKEKKSHDIIFRNGTRMVSLAVGFVDNGGRFNNGECSSMPSISLQIEHCWKETESLGALGWGYFAKYGGTKRKYIDDVWTDSNDDGTDQYTQQEVIQSNRWLAIGPLVSYHFTPTDKLDLFARAYAGFRFGKLDDYDTKDKYVYGVEGGVNYMLTSVLGIYASASYDATLVNVGLVLNLTSKRDPKSPTSKW